MPTSVVFNFSATVWLPSTLSAFANLDVHFKARLLTKPLCAPWLKVYHGEVEILVAKVPGAVEIGGISVAFRWKIREKMQVDAGKGY